jgi:hypothetical protein
MRDRRTLENEVFANTRPAAVGPFREFVGGCLSLRLEDHTHGTAKDKREWEFGLSRIRVTRSGIPRHQRHRR